MNYKRRISELKHLQNQVDAIRAEIGVSHPGEILFFASLDDLIVVEADGFGHATTSIVEGNYPVDFCTKFERTFKTEGEAVTTSDAIATGRVLPSAVLAVLT